MDQPKEIYKYAGFPIAEAIIASQSLRFTNPRSFNDPFDCDISGIYFDLNDRLDPKVQSEIEQLKRQFAPARLSNELLTAAYQETITNKLEKSVITCFSLDRNNHLMWAHYAHNHTGICLGFDNQIPIKEKFTDLEPGIEGVVLYDLPAKVNFCANKTDGNYKLYLIKQKPWAYEQEYRIVAIADEGIYHFRPDFLKEVIFGLRVSPEEINRVMRLVTRVQMDHLRFFSTSIKNADLIYTALN